MAFGRRKKTEEEARPVVAEPERTFGVVSVSDIMHRVLPSDVLVDPALGAVEDR